MKYNGIQTCGYNIFCGCNNISKKLPIILYILWMQKYFEKITNQTPGEFQYNDLTTIIFEYQIQQWFHSLVILRTTHIFKKYFRQKQVGYNLVNNDKIIGNKFSSKLLQKYFQNFCLLQKYSTGVQLVGTFNVTSTETKKLTKNFQEKINQKNPEFIISTKNQLRVQWLYIYIKYKQTIQLKSMENTIFIYKRQILLFDNSFQEKSRQNISKI
eukprot:TRINITY_DN7508_c0_g1_i1.p1 TRINITY_DN7508_c0_g1~~TRINITY_DN7508_c0_g1_i1.p1  ORF type:complete len:213 (-),score=-10.66 TRINITY_DN7508_c0_g1_i1:28-666(-)